MKTTLTIIAFVLAVFNSYAQPPEKMSYQAIIRDANDNLVTSQSIGMRISILQGDANGSVVYSETQSPISNSNGMVSIEIGEGNLPSGRFDAIDWAHGPYFIKTETDPTGGINYTITGTSQLLSVPYAMHSKSADTILGPVVIIENQTLADVAALDNTVNAQLKNVSDPTNMQDAATKAYVDRLEEKVIALEDLMIREGLYSVTDVDGNSYPVVKIGNQMWMAEILKTTRYNDGTAIPLVTENGAWSGLNTPGYCWYDNDSATYAASYGALYNWYTVETGKLCPVGWHVPADADWEILIDYVGGSSVGGNKLKESGTIHWNSPNTGANNESGFTALPGGARYLIGGSFDYIGEYGRWWSASGNITAWAFWWGLQSDNATVGNGSTDLQNGYSVRCLRD